MSTQNPIIPTPTQAKGIDAVVLDLQTALSTSLVWLTNGNGRAYRFSKVKQNTSTVFLPEIYLGTDKNTYFAATPDNDKKGQSVFLVGDGTIPDQISGLYGYLSYPIAIILNANLEKINSTLLLTDDFTEHLIEDVREVLIRGLLGKSYRLNIDSVQREFKDVYSEFDVPSDRGVEYLPLTHFRFNCTVLMREDCTGIPLDRCAAIMQNLTQADLLNCILPTYDFTQTTTQNATTAQQQLDLIAWLCAAPCPPPIRYSFDFDGVNEYILGQNGGVYNIEYNQPYSISAWIKRRGAMTIIDKFVGETGYGLFVLADGRILFEQRGGAYINGRAIEIATTVGDVPSGSWVNVIQTYDGSGSSAGANFYVNGSPVVISGVFKDGFGTPYTMLNAEPIKISGSPAFGIFSDGLMANTVMWNIELSSAEVLTEATGFFGQPLAIPVQVANAIMIVNVDSNKVKFGLDVFTINDESNMSSAYRTVNMEVGDLSLDVP
jgi:hypothetical protein